MNQTSKIWNFLFRARRSAAAGSAKFSVGPCQDGIPSYLMYLAASSGSRLVYSKLLKTLVVIGVCATLGTVGGAVAQDDSQASSQELEREYLIKAAFLYNFAKFTQWPEEAFGGPQAPLRICVLGADPFGAALDSIVGKSVQNREVVTARLATGSDAGGCHLLFIADSEQDQLSGILEGLVVQPILTISDMTDFAKSGGMINLKVAENRVKFSINLGVARDAALNFSSRLLNLAEIVGGESLSHRVSGAIVQ